MLGKFFKKCKDFIQKTKVLGISVEKLVMKDIKSFISPLKERVERNPIKEDLWV